MERVIITGASRGIGNALVREYLSRGAEVLALARDEEALSRLGEWARKEGKGRLEFLAIDLTRDDLAETLQKEVPGFVAEADVLVNNAGYLKKGAVEEVTQQDLDQSFAVNVFTPYRLVQIFLKALEKRGGQVINIGSMAGYPGSSKFPGLSAYGASKSAIAGLTESLAAELGPRGITVNCLALGGVSTGMLEEAFPGNEVQTTPEEMAFFIATFSMSGKSVMNGKVIPVSSSIP